MTINQTGPELSLADVLRAVWRFKWLVIVATVIGAGLSFLVGQGRGPVYSGKAFFTIDSGYEQTGALDASGSNFVSYQFVELMDAGAVNRLLNDSEREGGRVSSIRVQNAQTPTSIVVSLFGSDQAAVAKVLEEFPDRALQQSFIRTLFDRSQAQIKSQLEILRPVMTSASAGSFETKNDRFPAVRSFVELNTKMTELTRLNGLKSLFVRVGEIEGPNLVQVRSRMNSILGAVAGFLIGCGVAVFLSLRHSGRV